MVLQTADQGENTDDPLKMIGHGLNKSGEKEERSKHGKLKTANG